MTSYNFDKDDFCVIWIILYKNILHGLLVSNSAYKKLRCCHSILTTNKKLKRRKKPTALLESVREGRNRGKALPLRTERPTGKYRDTQVTTREGNGIPLQDSCLENPKDGGAWWAAVHEVAQSRTRLSNFTSTFHFHALEKEMATHSSVLAWRIPGTGEPGELPSMGPHRVGHDWSDLAVVAAL